MKNVSVGRVGSSLVSRLVLCAGLAACASGLVLGGCAGNSKGEYTQEHMNAAKQKMAALKSATEYQMAHQSFLAGDLPKALKHVTSSIELNEAVVKSHVLRGRIYMEMGNVELAAQALSQAEEMDGTNVEAWYFQGILAERIGQTDEALRRYVGAVERDGQEAQYAIAAAEMMMEQGQMTQARDFLTQRLASYPHSAGVKQTLGQLAMLEKRFDDAAQHLSDARMLAPDDQNITEDLIRAQLALGRFGDAESNLARLMRNKDNASRRDLKHLRAKCLVQIEKPVEARDIYLELTRDAENTNDVRAWIGLGELSYVLRDQARLRTSATRVVALAPELPDGYVLRALSQRKSGDLQGAMASLRQAISIREEAQTYMLLGMVQQDLNQIDASMRSFAAAAKLDPSNELAQELAGFGGVASDPTRVTGYPNQFSPTGE
jgi:tetratricopeptide (TPR) repeat protein